MNNKRPINLDLRSLHYPPMAIVSILHRLSGLALFVLLPLMMYFLSQSLHSSDSFIQLKTLLARPAYKLLLWVFCTALGYHLIAGIRHIIMDTGLGEGLSAGRKSAVVVIFLAIVWAILMGLWLC